MTLVARIQFLSELRTQLVRENNYTYSHPIIKQIDELRDSLARIVAAERRKLV